MAQFYFDAQKWEDARRVATVVGLKTPAADEDDRETWGALAALGREIETEAKRLMP